MPKSKEQCEQIKQQTRQKIIEKSILYFSRNGFSGTKINDLCKYIGIAPGSIYNYFETKEELFSEVRSIVSVIDLEPMRKLVNMPLPAKEKLKLLSKYLIKKLKDDPMFPSVITIETQELLENQDPEGVNAAYESESYLLLAKLIKQGQKEKTVVKGDAMKLADFYWGNVYLYALKRLFSENYIMIDADDLLRTLIKG